MKKILLNEINRMREIMGHSKLLVEVDRSKVAQFIEDIFAHGGDDAIKNIAREVDQELEDALIVLTNKKTGTTPVTDNQVDDALELLVKKIDARDIVKTMISKNLLPTQVTDGIEKIKDLARNKQISAIQYDTQIDKYVDRAFAGLDDEIRSAFKNEFKKQIPIEVKGVQFLTKDVLSELEVKFPELFKTRIFGAVRENPKQIKALEQKIKDGWNSSNKTRDKIISEVKVEAEELESIIRKTKRLTEDEKGLLQKFIDIWKKGAVGLILGYITIQLTKNWIKTGSPFGSVVKTTREEIKKTGEGFKSDDEESDDSGTVAPF